MGVQLSNAGDVAGGDLLDSVEMILSENTLCSLATVGSGREPYACTLYFAKGSGLDLVLFTGPETEHGKNLARDGRASISIADSRQDWAGSLRGVQLFGTMHRTSGIGSVKAFSFYAKRYAGILKSARAYSDLEGATDSRFYVFTPNRLKLLDELRFGRRVYLSSDVL